MKQKWYDWVFSAAIIIMALGGLVVCNSGFVKADSTLVKTESVKQEILTVYNSSGRVTGQAEDNPGWHRVMDTITLDDDAAVIVTLNTSTADGAQDVSFQSQTSYGGYAWSISDGRTIFTITPIDGHSFWVASSDTTARHTVYYLVEGQ